MQSPFWVCLGVLLPASAVAQTIIRDQVACSNCDLRSELVVRVGGKGVDHVGSTMMITRLRDGRVILAHDQAPDELRVFDQAGKFVGTIGRRGRGPGEFLNIRAINTKGDTILIHDLGNSRVTYLDSRLRVVGTKAFRPMSYPPAGVIVFADGTSIVNASIRTAELVGLPLHTVAPTGEIVSSFGSEDGAFRPDVVAAGRRRLSQSGPATVLVAHWTRYLIEEFTVGGKLVRSFERDAAWFKPWYRYPSRVDARTPVPPLLRAVRRDEDRLVWVVVEVPSREWGVAGSHGQTADGPQFVIDPVKSYDSIIEVLDLQDGKLLLSQRVDAHILHILPSGEMVAINELTDGTPVLELWRYRIQRR